MCRDLSSSCSVPRCLTVLDVDPRPWCTTLSQTKHTWQWDTFGWSSAHPCMLSDVLILPSELCNRHAVACCLQSNKDLRTATCVKAVKELGTSQEVKLAKSVGLKRPQTIKPGLLRTLLSSDGIYPWKNCSAKVQQTKICLQKWINEWESSPATQPKALPWQLLLLWHWLRKKEVLCDCWHKQFMHVPIYYIYCDCISKMMKPCLIMFYSVLFIPEKFWQLSVSLNGSFEVCFNKLPFSSAFIDMALLLHNRCQFLSCWLDWSKRHFSSNTTKQSLDQHHGVPCLSSLSDHRVFLIVCSSMVQLESLFL